jgi:acetylornithine/N-succinyldiaminopimelate aminotransferase
LAAELVENSCGDQVFFCNSGAEANEAAIKLARRYAQKIKGTKRFEIVTFQQSFHGRTLATLSATGQGKIQEGFLPLMPGFRYLPFNDLEALKDISSEETCAVLLEMVQGEGGVIPANREWIEQLAKTCKENNILLMVDEIQTGMGRTGTLFAYEQYGIEPDVVSIAKGLGSGFPIGAIIAKAEVAQAFDPGSHGSTFGGNPLAVTAGLATVQFIQSTNLLDNVKELSEFFYAQLQKVKVKFPIVENIRGKGLLIGMVVPGKAVEMVQKAITQNVLILTAGPDVVRILPPLTASKEEMIEFTVVLEDILQGMKGSE